MRTPPPPPTSEILYPPLNYLVYSVSFIFYPQRLDGRAAYDYRRICITFGVDRGCCQVEMGQTR